MTVRIGIGSTFVTAHLGRDAFFQHLETVEAQGWDSVWFSDRIVGAAPVIDPIVGMAVAASRTTRMQLGTGVLLMSMRSPVIMARALATLDVLSEGRLVVGVGIGQGANTEYDAMGVGKENRGQRLDEAIQVMRRLWSEESVSFQGRFLKLQEANVSPKPVRGSIPIWIGGRTEAAYQRAGRMGDGWLPTQVTAEDVALGIGRIREYAAAAGRKIPDDHYGLQISCYLVERGPVLLERIQPFLLARRQDVAVEQVNLVGTPDQVIAHLREFIDAGASKFVLVPACGPDEIDRQLELQASLLLPAFHTIAA
jgi:probable F420-dependent oxidoreductase